MITRLSINTAFVSALFCSIFLLIGCDKLTQYAISEQRINQQLQQRVQFSKNIGVSGVLNAHITLTNLQSQIGRQQPDVIRVTTDAKVVLTSLFGDQQAMLTLTLQTRPFFDRQQGAIYLHDVQLVESQASPEKMATVLKTLNPYLNLALKNYFDQYPVYVLDAAHSKPEALAKKYAKGIEVKPGEIVIPFSL